MPQLEFATYAGQLFWLALTFTVLYIVISRFIAPRIIAVLENRDNRLAADLNSAENAKNKAKGLTSSHEEELKSARNRAREAVDAATAEAKARQEKRQAELNASIQEKLAEAEAKVLTISKDSDKFVTFISQKLQITSYVHHI